MKIKSIKKIDYKDDVYNLHIKDNHNYFANNHCVSNCHELDDILSDFISIKITEFFIKRFKFANEYSLIKDLKAVKTVENYVNYLKYINSEIITTIEQMESGMASGPRNAKSDKRDIKISKVLNTKNNDIKMMNNIADLKQYQLKIDLFLKEYKENPNNWVLEKTWNEKNRNYEFSLEPIWAYDYMDKYIFNQYDKVFLMSGTILDKSLFCQLNGLDVEKTAYYSIDSPFPVKNRPVYYMPLGKMSFTSKEETFKRYVPYINKLVNKYNNKKGIIHTNSFELSNWIQKDVKNERLVFHDSTNKDDVLRKHLEGEDASVIVSPSMSTGVSFDDEGARFQILAKVPYPHLGSMKNKMRMQNNPDWYAWKTCANILQAMGRIVRSNTDYGDTIIIDGSFGDVLKHSTRFLPNWFQIAIKRVNVKIEA